MTHTFVGNDSSKPGRQEGRLFNLQDSRRPQGVPAFTLPNLSSARCSTSPHRLDACSVGCIGDTVACASAKVEANPLAVMKQIIVAVRDR
jgi:hypothetical protein